MTSDCTPHQDLQQLRAFFIAKDASAVPQGISPARVDEVCRPLHALLRLLSTPSEPLLQLWEVHESERAAAAAAAGTAAGTAGTSEGAVASTSGATHRAHHGARAPAFREVEALGAHHGARAPAFREVEALGAHHGARAPAFREVEALGAPLAQHGAWPVIGTWGVADARGDVLTTAQGDVWSLPQIVQVG